MEANQENVVPQAQASGGRPKNYTRKVSNFLINRPLQRQYSLLMIGVMVASSLVTAVVIQTTIRSAFLGNPYRIGAINPYEALSTVNDLLIVRVGLTLLVCIFFATALGVVFLHRVAGPVYRFHLILKEMATGKIPRKVKLREGDYFVEVAQEFNNVFERWERKEVAVEEVMKEFEKLKDSGLSADQVKKLLRVLSER